MQRTLLVMLIGVISCLPAAYGQEPSESFRFAEIFTKDRQYHVTCQVEIAGSMPVPAADSAAAGKTLKIAGKSAIKYDERILKLAVDGRVERTVRFYRQMDFERKVGDQEQRSHLRSDVRRLVILRHNQYEVPFCPTGPLTWGEIDLVRTDVFVPALAGLLPVGPVRVGDRWSADNVAIQELTDLDKIDKADFVCTFEKVTTLLGRRNAQIDFTGTVQGIGEDGNARHELRGTYYVDVDANFISYLYVKGIHHLLDKTGAATGQIEGTFVMTRTQSPQTLELADEALRGLTLEPNADNTLLLFDQPQVGVRFLYPRNWRVAGANNKQIGIDEKHGSGILITLSPATATPTGAQFHQETASWLAKQSAKIVREEKTRPFHQGMETFTFEAELAKEKVVLQYFVTRQGNYGATLAVRVTPGDVNGVLRDVDRIVRSLQLQAPR